MNVLILKLGATGDVVRTTPLLSRLNAQITWLTAPKNTVLLEDVKDNVRCFSWEERERALDTDYDLAINLEDTLDVAQFLKTVRCGQRFGAYVDSTNSLRYTEDFRRWFDLSLISTYGKQKADKEGYCATDPHVESFRRIAKEITESYDYDSDQGKSFVRVLSLQPN